MQPKVRRGLAALTLVDLAAAAGVSGAAVQPASAQPAPSFNWTGFYIGAHAGYRSGDAVFTGNPYTITPAGFGGNIVYPGRNDSFSPSGFFGGPYVGYNFQFNPNWLVGLEGDYSFGKSKKGVSASITHGPPPGTNTDGFTTRNSELTLTWQATVRARAGYVIQSALFYVTGGVAFAHVKWSDSTALTGDDAGEFISASVSTSKTLTGFVVGGGYEQMLTQNMMWRVEYLYESFNADFTVPHGFGQQGILDLEHIHKIRFGLTFKY